jgi:hypothetical protein
MEFLSRLVLDAPAAVLSWLGRQGTRAVAALIVFGIVLPSIGALLKPLVTEAVFVLLCIAFLRVDAAAFRIYLRRPTIVLAATVWTSFVIPLVRRELSGVRPQRSVTGSLPRPCTASYCLAPDGGPSIRRVDGASYFPVQK